MFRKTLDKMYFVVTRPEAQAVTLHGGIKKAGGKTLSFPTLLIKPLDDLRAFIEIFKKTRHIDIIIFASPNAAEIGLSVLQREGITLSDSTIIGMGAATEQALKSGGITATILTPAGQTTSETLLELDALQHTEDKTVVIVRGAGGRAFLGDRLTERGARVIYAECYQRFVPDINPDILLNHLKHGKIDAIIISSVVALENLFDMAGPKGQKWLQQASFLVTSQRIAEACKKAGVTGQVVIADNALESSIINALYNRKHS